MEWNGMGLYCNDQLLFVDICVIVYTSTVFVYNLCHPFCPTATVINNIWDLWAGLFLMCIGVRYIYKRYFVSVLKALTLSCSCNP